MKYKKREKMKNIKRKKYSAENDFQNIITHDCFKIDIIYDTKYKS
jgi:hypothetical protein